MGGFTINGDTGVDAKEAALERFAMMRAHIRHIVQIYAETQAQYPDQDCIVLVLDPRTDLKARETAERVGLPLDSVQIAGALTEDVIRGVEDWLDPRVLEGLRWERSKGVLKALCFAHFGAAFWLPTSEEVEELIRGESPQTPPTPLN